MLFQAAARRATFLPAIAASLVGASTSVTVLHFALLYAFLHLLIDGTLTIESD